MAGFDYSSIIDQVAGMPEPARQRADDERTDDVPRSAGGDQVDQFIDSYLPLAQRKAQEMGVSPVSILSQIALETGYGKSIIPGTNNLFNVKDFSGNGTEATDNQTGSRDKYRTYQSADESADDWGNLIARRYKGVLGTGDNSLAYFQALKNGGYAEDKDYVSKGLNVARTLAARLGQSGRANPQQADINEAWDRYDPSLDHSADPSRQPVFEPGEESLTDAFLRNMQKTLPQTKQLLSGAGALAADTIGLDGVRDYLMESYKSGEESTQALTRPTDAWSEEGSDNLGKFVAGSAGYFTGQILESLGVALASGAIGSAAGGVGAAPAALGGLLLKGEAKAAIKTAVKELMEASIEKSIGEGLTKEAAEKVAGMAAADFAKTLTQKAVGKELATGAAMIGQGVGMETGEIYGSLYEQAQKEGRAVTDDERARAWLYGGLAGAVEGAVDKLNLDAVIGGGAKSAAIKDRILGVLRGAGKAEAREVPTEVMQTGLERAGKGQEWNPSNPEAAKEYIDTAAMTAAGAWIPGVGGARVEAQQEQAPAKPERQPNSPLSNAANAGAPAVTSVNGAGVPGGAETGVTPAFDQATANPTQDKVAYIAQRDTLNQQIAGLQAMLERAAPDSPDAIEVRAKLSDLVMQRDAVNQRLEATAAFDSPAAARPDELAGDPAFARVLSAAENLAKSPEAVASLTPQEKETALRSYAVLRNPTLDEAARRDAATVLLNVFDTIAQRRTDDAELRQFVGEEQAALNQMRQPVARGLVRPTAQAPAVAKHAPSAPVNNPTQGPTPGFGAMTEFEQFLGEERGNLDTLRRDIAENARAQKEGQLQDIGAAIDGNRAKQTAENRGKILDAVLADPAIKDHAKAFRAALMRAGRNDYETITPDETARIARFAEVNETFPQDEAPAIEPSAPNEMPAGLVREKGSRTGDRQKAKPGYAALAKKAKEKSAARTAAQPAPAGMYALQPAAEGQATTSATPKQDAKPAAEVKAKSTNPIMQRDDIVGAIMRATGGDGIASSMALTLTGDTANNATKLRGLFTNAGQEDMDDLAMLLRENEGYDVKDGVHLAELIRDAADGNYTKSMARTAQDKADAEEKQHRDAIRRQAKKLGIKTAFVAFSKIEQDVLALLEQRHAKAVELMDERSLAKFNAVLEQASNLLPEDVIDATLSDVHGRGFAGRDFWNEATKILRGMARDAEQERINDAIDNAREGDAPAFLEEDSDEPGNQSAGRGSPVDQGDQAQSSEAPAFGLEGQTLDEIDQQEAARVAAERERAAESAREAAEKAKAEKKSLDDAIKAHAANPDNFTFGESGKDAAKPMASLFDQPAQKPEASPAVSEMDALKAEMGQAIGELASILGVKTNMTPEEEVRILPVMSKIFRIAAKMGYITFKDAAVHVVKQLRELGGKELADKISIDNLQSGYINIAKEIGGSKKEALEYESLDELMAGHDALVESIAAAEKKTDSNPSDAQKEADNYRKGKFDWNGWKIAVETPKGVERSGKGEDGAEWRVKMRTTYGYFLGTKGADKDHVDVFVGDHPESNKVFIIDQNKVDSQAFDEHKVMIGFTSADDAQVEYLLSFSGTFGGRVFGRISDALTPEQLKEVMPSLAKKKPFTKPAEEFNYVEPAPGNETPARTELKKVVDNTQAPSVAEPKGWRTSWGTASKYAEALGLSTRNAAGKSMKLPELTAAIEAKLSGRKEEQQPATQDAQSNVEFIKALENARKELPEGFAIQPERNSVSLMFNGQYAVNGLGRNVSGIQEALRLAKNRAAEDVKNAGPSQQYKNYAEWIEGGKEVTPGLLEQIRADERLNDGEADKLVAMAEEKRPKARRPIPGDADYTLELAREDLDAMHENTGERWFAEDDRLTERIKRQETLIKEMEAEVAKPASVKDLALAEQRAAGWNPDWPFIPADLGNADFRGFIAADESLSIEEREQIFSAGKKLNVIPLDEDVKPAAPVSKVAQLRAKLGKTDPIKLSNITVQVPAVVAETGETVQVKERADLAMKDIDQRIELAKGLLECLVS